LPSQTSRVTPAKACTTSPTPAAPSRVVTGARVACSPATARGPSRSRPSPAGNRGQSEAARCPCHPFTTAITRDKVPGSTRRASHRSASFSPTPRRTCPLKPPHLPSRSASTAAARLQARYGPGGCTPVRTAEHLIISPSISPRQTRRHQTMLLELEHLIRRTVEQLGEQVQTPAAAPPLPPRYAPTIAYAALIAFDDQRLSMGLACEAVGAVREGLRH
jgi:hypothetical protein